LSADSCSCSARQVRSGRSPESCSVVDWRFLPRSFFCGCSDRGRRIMADVPTYRPVYKALHRPLTVCGVDRRLFFLALLLGAATFNLFSSFADGLLMFLGLYSFALRSTKRDPDLPRMLPASAGSPP